MAKSQYVGHAHKIKPIKKMSTTGGGVTEAPFLREIYSQLMAVDEGRVIFIWRKCPLEGLPMPQWVTSHPCACGQ